MKKILTFLTVLVPLLVSSCTKAEFGSSIGDLIGTEWSYTDNEGGTIGLKFYANNAVTSFLDNRYGIATINGTYEYIASSKTIALRTKKNSSLGSYTRWRPLSIRTVVR